MRTSIFYILLPALLFSSCFKEIDTVAQLKSTEEVFTSQHNISRNVTFFKIYPNTTQEVSNKSLGGWDMAFQSAEEGDNVLVNYTVSAKVIKTGTSNFSEVNKETVNALFNSDEWKFNDPAYSNIKDSIGLKSWEDKEVYLVNRGSASLPEEAYYKIQFVSKTPESYTFKYAHVESTGEIEKTINRTSSLANVYFSFTENAVVEHEPNINEWDFYFAPYFGWFETLTAGEYSPYNMTGAMINNEGGVRIAQVFDGGIDYNSIDLTMAHSLTYTDWKGAIGSTWKKIPSTENPIYLMDTDKKYVIELDDGNYYKLRFLDYYLDGKQGFPSFEINAIK
ncbi:HmuY family protein [Gelidibacter sp.]|uniref:HmuY family protein n=1 Tax=Gelidibacter sp. TaxID=2018083 RepID=UPI002B6367D4|nr:HmuY family protein [Gelidibacter sp.]HUH28573.1 HmuY family protein [Gelidibacter sp.]